MRWLETGQKVARFKHYVITYKGIKYTAAFNSYVTALHLSILATHIK